MRAPYQTLTILYKKENEQIKFAIFYRNSHPIWQFVSGGGEDNETPIETVVREIKEETSLIIDKNEIRQLDSRTTIPVLNITGKYTWGDSVFVVPEYTFAVELKKYDIKLSNEHKEYKWVEYNEAMWKGRYDSNKTALWELNERLIKIKMERSYKISFHFYSFIFPFAFFLSSMKSSIINFITVATGTAKNIPLLQSMLHLVLPQILQVTG